MPEKHGQQKRSSARRSIGDMSLPSSADNPPSRRSPVGSFGRTRSSELKLDLDARIASLRQNSTSYEDKIHSNSRKRAAEESLDEQSMPKKRYKSAAAMAVERVLETVHRGSAMAYEAYQTYKIKLTNRMAHQTLWQRDQSKQMRGCGVDFEPISDFAGGRDFGSLSPKVSSIYHENAHKGDSSGEKAESDCSTSMKLPAIDSENWYWISHDLRVTVIVTIYYNALMPYINVG
jgi:hypothetical protein